MKHMKHMKHKNNGSQIFSTTTDVALNSINIGLTVGSALAWNEYFKTLISKLLSGSRGQNALLAYAIGMTLLTTLILIATRVLTKNKFKKKTIYME